MRSHANSTGHSMIVIKFESDSSKNNTYTQITLEIIMTAIQFSTLLLLPMKLIL